VEYRRERSPVRGRLIPRSGTAERCSQYGQIAVQLVVGDVAALVVPLDRLVGEQARVDVLAEGFAEEVAALLGWIASFRLIRRVMMARDCVTCSASARSSRLAAR